MNYQDQVMWNLLVNIRVETLKLVANLDERSIDLVPEGFHNSIRWNIGHIVYDQDVWFHYLIEDESAIPKAYEKFFWFWNESRNLARSSSFLGGVVRASSKSARAFAKAVCC